MNKTILLGSIFLMATALSSASADAGQKRDWRCDYTDHSMKRWLDPDCDGGRGNSAGDFSNRVSNDNGGGSNNDNDNDNDTDTDNDNSNGNNNGNNGHGNDEDGNDDSNPGNSNDPGDNTDDDGTPGNN